VSRGEDTRNFPNRQVTRERFKATTLGSTKLGPEYSKQVFGNTTTQYQTRYGLARESGRGGEKAGPYRRAK
jgi:hypothetical protein